MQASSVAHQDRATAVSIMRSTQALLLASLFLLVLTQSASAQRHFSRSRTFGEPSGGEARSGESRSSSPSSE